MKRIDKWGVILFLAAVAVWCIGMFMAQRINDMAGFVSAAWPQGGGVSPAQLSRHEEYARQDGAQNMPEVTLWGQTPQQIVSGGADRCARAMVVELFGQCEDISPAGLLAGGFPARGDNAGCAISEKLAFELWGSIDVVGKTITWNDEQYWVRGVFEGNDLSIYVQKDAADTNRLPNMQLGFPDGGSRDEAREYLLRAGFTGAQLLDLPLIGWFINAIAWLPAMTLGMSVLSRLLRRGLKLRFYPLLAGSYLPFAAVTGAVCLLLMGFPWNVPVRLIPTKWSDLEFWGLIFGDLANSIQCWLSAPTGWDMVFWPKALITVFLAIGAVALMAAALKRVKIMSGKWLIAISICSMGVMLLAALILAPHGGLHIGTGMWLLPLMWLAVNTALILHEKMLKPKTAKEADCETKALEAQQKQAFEKQTRITKD